ncbi:MAG TPA: hypothetical protein VLA13_00505 [Massilibacterium sp.]|nr:hypothetical protein [Massilibacterium sp.]
MNRFKLSLIFIFIIVTYTGAGYFIGYVLDMAFMTSDYYGKAVAFTTTCALIIIFSIIVTIIREGNGMEREEIIETLLMRTGIRKEVLESMTDEELNKLYAERVLSKGMI